MCVALLAHAFLSSKRTGTKAVLDRHKQQTAFPNRLSRRSRDLLPRNEASHFCRRVHARPELSGRSSDSQICCSSCEGIAVFHHEGIPRTLTSLCDQCPECTACGRPQRSTPA